MRIIYASSSIFFVEKRKNDIEDLIVCVFDYICVNLLLRDSSYDTLFLFACVNREKSNNYAVDSAVFFPILL